METLENEVKAIIRDVPNFPKEGIVFKDITPVLADPEVNMKVLSAFREAAEELCVDVVVGIDSRGFLYGNVIAGQLGVAFAPVRKKGKLPYKTLEESYALEYGEATLEIHTDAISKGARVLIHDDLLATGGTALAAANLIERLGGKVVGFSFLVNLSFLEGAKKLSEKSDNLFSVVTY